jgi:hypothetical protein
VFENRVFRRTFGPKGEEVKEEWISPNNEELYDLSCLPHIIRLIKSRRMRFVGNLARMEERRGEVHTGFWWRNLRERDNLENPGVDGRTIL